MKREPLRRVPALALGAATFLLLFGGWWLLSHSG